TWTFWPSSRLCCPQTPGRSSYQVFLLGLLLRIEAVVSPRLRGFCLLFLCQQGTVLSPRKEERET
ncbi:unnamed protein product, partial [Gulo gulo]